MFWPCFAFSAVFLSLVTPLESVVYRETAVLSVFVAADRVLMRFGRY